jgi:hypothetical protein
MRRKTVYLSALLSLCLSFNVAKAKTQEILQEETTRQLSQNQPTSEKPTEVAVGLYLIDFDEFDEKNEYFKLDGYLFLTWKDKRLAFNPSQTRANNKVYNLGEIWSPNARFLNIEHEREPAYTQLKVKLDGTVYYKERFTGQFNSEMTLKRFPFDSQKIELILESPLDDIRDVAFVVDNNKIGKSQDAFLTGWTIGESKAMVRARKSEIEEVYFNEFIYQINISRNSKPYVWNIILPLVFIIGISWTVFWSRSFESNTVIATSSLLSAIAFNIVVAEELPKVSYLTFMNGFILTIYVFIYLVIIYTVLKHWLDLEKKKELWKRNRLLC